MTQKIRIAPAPDSLVRKPDKSLLDPAGEIVVRDHYWDRRIMHGDVIQLELEAPAPADASTDQPKKGDVK